MAAAIAWMIYPTWYWARNGLIEEWMIYRFVVSELLGTIALMLVCFSYLVRKAADINLSDQPWRDRYRGAVGWAMSRWWFPVVPICLIAFGLAGVWEGLVQYLTTGEVTQHWSRFVLMSGLLSAAAVLALTRILDACLNLLAGHVQYLHDARSDDSGL